MGSNFLRQLGQGLRAWGATTSQDNFNTYNQQNQFRSQQDEQRKQLMLGLLVKGVENGVIDEPTFQKLSSQYGYSDMPYVGPSTETQKFELEKQQSADVNRKKDYLKQFSLALPEGTNDFNKSLAMEQAAISLGLKDEAGMWGGRASRLKPPNTVMPKYFSVFEGKYDDEKNELYQDYEIKLVNGKLSSSPVGKPHKARAGQKISVDARTEIPKDEQWLSGKYDKAVESFVEGRQQIQSIKAATSEDTPKGWTAAASQIQALIEMYQRSNTAAIREVENLTGSGDLMSRIRGIISRFVSGKPGDQAKKELNDLVAAFETVNNKLWAEVQEDYLGHSKRYKMDDYLIVPKRHRESVGKPTGSRTNKHKSAEDVAKDLKLYPMDEPIPIEPQDLD